MVTDLDELARRAKREENENWRFRSRVKGSSMSDARLDGLVRETSERVAAQIDCTTCANCCRHLEPEVSGEDIERLGRRLGISADEFKDRYVFRTELGDQCIRGMPCPFLDGNLCSVYEDRPATCRGYPYLSKAGFRQRLMGVVMNAEVCPIVYNSLTDLKAALRFRSGRRSC